MSLVIALEFYSAGHLNTWLNTLSMFIQSSFLCFKEALSIPLDDIGGQPDYLKGLGLFLSNYKLLFPCMTELNLLRRPKTI